MALSPPQSQSDDLSLSHDDAGGARYTGMVDGGIMTGKVVSGGKEDSWTAKR